MTIVMKPASLCSHLVSSLLLLRMQREHDESAPRPSVQQHIPKVLAARLHMQLSHCQASSAP